MVMVDKLGKVTYFIPIKLTYKAINIADRFMREIFRLHGTPKIIIDDRDAKFTSIFWTSLFTDMDTKLNFSIAYHPQKNGQTKRVNGILKDT